MSSQKYLFEIRASSGRSSIHIETFEEPEPAHDRKEELQEIEGNDGLEYRIELKTAREEYLRKQRVRNALDELVSDDPGEESGEIDCGDGIATDGGRNMSLDAFGTGDDADDSAGDWPPFDEFGPTADEPIPEAERASFDAENGPVDRREIPDSGLSVSDFTDWTLENEERRHPHREEAYQEFLEAVDNPRPDAGGYDVEPETAEPCNVHTDYTELEEIPENVPIGASEADRELAKRALRKTKREYGHHDPTRRALRSFYRDVDDRENLRDAARNLGPSEINMATIPGETEAWAVLHWLETDHADLVDEARQEYVDDLRERCEKALKEQRKREKDRDFAANPPEELNGWERFESEKPDVEVAYCAVNYGTPSVVAVYRDEAGELQAHESTLEEWNEAETAAESKVNRHIVSVTNDRSVYGDLRNHLERYDGEPIEAEPDAPEGYDRLLNPGRIADEEAGETAILAYYNEERNHLVGILRDEHGLYVGEGDRYQPVDSETKEYKIRRGFAVVESFSFEYPEHKNGRLLNAEDAATVATGIMEHGSISEYVDANKSEENDDGDDDPEPVCDSSPFGWEVEKHAAGGNVDINGHRETIVWERETDGARVWVEMRDSSYSSDDYKIRSSFVGVPETDGILASDLTRPGAIERAREHMAANQPDQKDQPDGADADAVDASSSKAAATDGGEIETAAVAVDPETFDVADHAGETVRLITGITGLMHTPETLEAEISGSGNTIGAEHQGRTHRLDTETILTGESEYRDSRYFEIYTPSRLQKNQRANHAPGPQAGANEVSDCDDLPAPTHWPAIEQPDDVPDECPGCGAVAAPFQTKNVHSPRCEACGRTLEEMDGDTDDEEEADETGETADLWDLSQYGRGTEMLLDKFAGSFVVVKQKRTQFGDVLALDVVDEDLNVFRLKKLDRGGYCFDVRAGEYDGGAFRPAKGSPVVRNMANVDDVQDFEVIGEDMDRVRQWIRDRYGDGGPFGGGDGGDGGGGGGDGGDDRDDSDGGTPDTADQDSPRLVADGGRTSL